MDGEKRYIGGMASFSIGNIPEPTLERVRALAAAERRSLNEEILVILERGMEAEEERVNHGKTLARSAQLELWEQLVGTWKDSRTASEIIEDIYCLRTSGRDAEM